MPQVTTTLGTDENGKLLYSREEYEKLEAHVDNLNDEAFEDFVTAEAEGRVRGSADGSASTGGKTYTRSEWEAASKRTDQMSASEFAAWESAPEDGRITD